MLRIILRNTHNALLLACILLLICSLERLCRYDFAQIQVASSAQPDGLQIDNFVFWGGIPAWDHQYTNSHKSVSALGFFSKAMTSWSRARSSSLFAEEYLNVPEEAVLPSVEQNKVMLRRQMPPSHGKQPQGFHNESQSSSSSSNFPVVEAMGSSSETSIKDERAEDISGTTIGGKPKVGFLLHLTTCDREEVERWRSVWAEEQRVVDRPFLFAVVLEPKVMEGCISQLESHLSTSQIANLSFQVFKSKRAIMTLQRCQSSPESVLTDTLGGLDELVYYDGSSRVNSPKQTKAPLMRRFLLNSNVVPSFRCTSEELKISEFCNNNKNNNETLVHDCPRFQYTPFLQREGPPVPIKE